MKRSEVEALAEQHVHHARVFRRWLWFFILPLLGALWAPFMAAGYHPPAHHPPVPFSCASQRADDTVLGDSGSIAPLCGEAP